MSRAASCQLVRAAGRRCWRVLGDWCCWLAGWLVGWPLSPCFRVITRVCHTHSGCPEAVSRKAECQPCVWCRAGRPISTPGGPSSAFGPVVEVVVLFGAGAVRCGAVLVAWFAIELSMHRCAVQKSFVFLCVEAGLFVCLSTPWLVVVHKYHWARCVARAVCRLQKYSTCFDCPLLTSRCHTRSVAPLVSGGSERRAVTGAGVRAHSRDIQFCLRFAPGCGGWFAQVCPGQGCTHTMCWRQVSRVQAA